MTRLPSVTPRNLGDFVSQVLQNEQELRTVGSTPLERQLTNLTGGVQVGNMPQSFQQLIATDRALGGGGGSGPLTITNPFTRDDLTPGQQKRAANEMARQQGTIPPFAIGETEPLSPGAEIGFQQGGRSVRTPTQDQGQALGAAQQALQLSAPLVRAGVLSGEDARDLAKSTALNAVTDIQDRNNARRQIRAVNEQFRAGRLDVQQVASAKEQLLRDFGAPTLQSIPEWAAIDGSESQFQEQVAQRIKTQAERNGLPEDAFTFDPQSGRVVRNDEWFAIQDFKNTETERLAKPRQEAIKTMNQSAIKTFEIGMTNLRKQVELVAVEDRGAALGLYNRESHRLFNQLQSSLGQVTDGQGPDVQQAADQAPASAALTHPSLPTGVNLSGAFVTIDEVRAFNPPPGSYFTVSGTLIRRTLNGRFEVVQ